MEGFEPPRGGTKNRCLTAWLHPNAVSFTKTLMDVISEFELFARMDIVSISMKIIQIAAELAPIAKVGGLGDVVTGLSRALLKMGHELQILLPKYSCIRALPPFKKSVSFTCLESGKEIQNTAHLGEVEGCDVWFLETQHPEGYFHEKTIYAGDNDPKRFLFFCHMALEFLKKEPAEYLLHIHDWHTAFIPPLYHAAYSKDIEVKGIVLNIHNLEYQGRTTSRYIPKELLGKDTKNILEKLKDDHASFPDSINLLKGGIHYADKVVTVSPNYAKEILTVEQGFGLEDTLRKNDKKLIGILNGLDTGLWNPETDPHIPAHFRPDDPIDVIVQKKRENKKHLQRKIGFKEENKPLVSCVSRLVPQKGPELILGGLIYSLSQDAQACFLGSSPVASLQKKFETFQKELFSKEIHFHFQYDEEFSRLLYAASDFILVPSLFEPCGLTQLISLRYGTIPIVRRTGGLADTVFDIDSTHIKEEKKNGYTFDSFSLSALEETLLRAFNRYNQHPEEHQNLLIKGIRCDFGWEKSAKEYLKIYQSLQG